MRRRYRWNPETMAMEEIGADYTGAERRAPVATEALIYGNLGKSTDGTPIDSRTKHRTYMKENNLALASDYTETWKRAEKERNEFFRGEGSTREIRDDIGRAQYAKRRK